MTSDGKIIKILRLGLCQNGIHAYITFHILNVYFDSTQRHRFLYTLTAEDNGRPSLAGFCTFRVKIGDKNDHPPVFDFAQYSTSIEEGSVIGKRVLQVYATDKDAGNNGNVMYKMKVDPSGFFTINHHSGWITVARAMSGVRQFLFIK